MQESDEVEERLRWALSKLPRWAVRVDTGGMWVAVSPTYDLDGLVIYGRSAEELVHRVQVQVCVEAMALDRGGRRPPGGVLCGVDFTGLVAEADQFDIRTEGALHLPGAVPAFSPGGPVPPGAPLPTLGGPPPSVLTTAQTERLLGTIATGPGRGGNPNGTRATGRGGNASVDADPPKPKPAVPEGRAFGFEGDPCPECGLMAMVRNGSCLKCTSCGATTGCS